MKLFRKEEGFTLVELMVVVLIIGILVAIAIPVFNAAKSNAQTKQCIANQRTVAGQSRAYEAETGNLPADLNALEAGNYIKDVPVCNGGGTYTYDAAEGVISCSDANHVY